MGLGMGSPDKTLQLEVDLLLFTNIRRNFLVGCTSRVSLRINNLVPHEHILDFYKRMVHYLFRRASW